MDSIVKELAISASPATININVDKASAGTEPLYGTFRVTGTHTLAGVLTFAAVGTPATDTSLLVYWSATISSTSPNLVNFLGTVLPEEIVAKNCILFANYNGSSWDVYDLVSFHEDGVIDGSMIELATIADDKIIDLDGSKIQAGTITDTEMSDMDAAKLSGTLAAARIADASLGNELLSEITLLTSSVTSLATAMDTVEATLFTGTIPAAELTDGDAAQLKAYVAIGGTVNAKTIRVYVDGIQITSNTVTTAPNGTDLIIDLTIQRVGNTSARTYGTYAFNGIAPEVTVVKSSAVTDFDVSGAAVLVTGQNGVGAVANEITLNAATLTLVR